MDLFDRFASQCRPTLQAKKRYWPLLDNGIEMLTVTAGRLDVTVQASLHLDFLLFICSVAAGLLQNTTGSTSLRPSGRRIMNNSVGLHHPVNTKCKGLCDNCEKTL